MQQKYKERIRTNWSTLVRNLSAGAIVNYLKQKDVILAQELNDVLCSTKDPRHNNRMLLFLIEKKDDAVFLEFVTALRETGYNHLYELLTLQSSTRNSGKVFAKASYNNIENVNASKLPVVNEKRDEEELEFPKIKVVLSEKFEDIESKHRCGVYSTRSKQRGQVLILNNKTFDNKEMTRRGSEVDVYALTELFTQMHMAVQVHEDLTIEEIKKVIREFVKFSNDKIADISIVFVMSHGKLMGQDLMIVDRTEKFMLPVRWIEEQFNNVNCALFLNKPKLFFYQTCRGANLDYAITKPLPRVQTDSAIILRPTEDMIVGYATQQGTQAHRHTKFGSWYIQVICKVFMEHAHDTALTEMLNQVDERLKYPISSEYSVQTPSYEVRGFSKGLYFNPGIYEDEEGNLNHF